MEATVEGEVLKRLGISAESASRLARKVAEAEAVLGIHGLSVTAGGETRPHSRADRPIVQAVLPVPNTPPRTDPFHRTIELPKPVATAIAARFNRCFGRDQV